MEKTKDPIIFPDNTAYLPGISAAVTFSKESQEIFESTDEKPIPVDELKEANKDRGIVPWGSNNNMPSLLMEKVYQSPILSSGMLFNIQMGFGDGVLPCYVDYNEDGEKRLLPYKMKYDAVKEKKESLKAGEDGRPKPSESKPVIQTYEEVDKFFRENDISGWLLEAVTDMNFFYNIFPEIVFNLADHGNRKIVELVHREACFSRWEKMDPKTGRIEKHFYSTEWSKMSMSLDPAKIHVTDVLDYRNPVKHLKEVLKEEAKKNLSANRRINRWIIPVSFPTPGRTYYQKPYWYSLIESGWYDQAVNIPLAKNALMENGMDIKYHIRLAHDYFASIFKRENITDPLKQKDRIKTEYDNINKYLSGRDNKGKSLITKNHRGMEGKEQPALEIEKLDNPMGGGEYIADNEEASNILSYGIGVHPSLIGSSPGKNKTINGTEARELYLIKQIMTKPIRDRLLRPFYLIKEINGWDRDLEFTIPNIMLTTLDKNKTGTETNTE
jgi:hypothetical protein